MAKQTIWDVVIVGAGPAGLSAALILARSRRHVLLVDRQTPRSWASKALHGFLSREGISPVELRQIARRELDAFPNIRYRITEVTEAHRLGDSLFEVRAGARFHARCRKLLIATGLMDHLPPIPRIERYFGQSVFQCPYCDGWETRDQPIAVYGRGNRGFEMARAMTAWNRDILLCTDGASRLAPSARSQLKANDIRLIETRIERLEGTKGQLEAIVFAQGQRIARRALYFDMPSFPQAQLAESLGCERNRRGGIRCGQYEATSVPGVFVAGNVIRDVQLSIVAAAEGARAAFGINRALTREDFVRKASGRRSVDHPPLQEPKTEALLS